MAVSWLSTVPALQQFSTAFDQTAQANVAARAANGYQPIDPLAVIQNQVDEAQRRADQQYGLQVDTLKQQWKVARLTAKTNAEKNAIDKWYNEAQIDVARQRLAEDSRQFNVKTGYDVLNMGAQLQGPRNWAQYQRLASGAAANPNTATLFNNLGQAATSGGYKGFGPGQLDPVTLGSLVQDLTGGGSNAFAAVPGVGQAPTAGTAAVGGINGAPAGGAQADLDREKAAAQYYIMNPHKIGAGVINSWNPDKQDMFASLIGASGASVPTWLDTLRRSRIGNQYGSNAA